MNKDIQEMMDLGISEILKSKNIYIISHVNPDGDNLGSCLSLALGLKKIKEDVFILKVDETPSDFLFLPGIEMIRDYKTDEDIDLLIAVDSSDINRLGRNKDLIESANLVINIDHHISNTNFGDINIIDTRASATGELIYSIIEKMKIDIDEDIATCIYTALSTDTGSFKYDNTTDKTHKIASELIKSGADKKSINLNIYQNRSLERTNLFIKAMNSMEMHLENRVGVIKITKDILDATQTTMEDSEGIIEYVRSIGPVEIAILLKEFGDEETKVSMRSKKDMDVAEICAIFNGGGHKRAAGCTINKSIVEADQILLEEVKKAFKVMS